MKLIRLQYTVIEKSEIRVFLRVERCNNPVLVFDEIPFDFKIDCKKLIYLLSIKC